MLSQAAHSVSEHEVFNFDDVTAGWACIVAFILPYRLMVRVRR